MSLSIALPPTPSCTIPPPPLLDLPSLCATVFRSPFLLWPAPLPPETPPPPPHVPLPASLQTTHFPSTARLLPHVAVLFRLCRPRGCALLSAPSKGEDAHNLIPPKYTGIFRLPLPEFILSMPRVELPPPPPAVPAPPTTLPPCTLRSKCPARLFCPPTSCRPRGACCKYAHHGPRGANVALCRVPHR